jgi:hypothetical protein
MSDLTEPVMTEMSETVGETVGETLAKPAAGYLSYLNPFQLDIPRWATTAGLVAATAGSSAVLYLMYRRSQEKSYTDIKNIQDILDAAEAQDSPHPVEVAPPRIPPKPLTPLQRMENRVNGRECGGCMENVAENVGDRVASCKFCKPAKPHGSQLTLNLEHGGLVLLDPSLSQKPQPQPPTEGWGRAAQAQPTYPHYNSTGSI